MDPAVSAPPLKGTARVCAGKRRYPDEALARATAMHSLEERPEVRVLYVYHCDACRGWRLTKQRHGNRRAVTAAEPVADRSSP